MQLRFFLLCALGVLALGSGARLASAQNSRARIVVGTLAPLPCGNWTGDGVTWACTRDCALARDAVERCDEGASCAVLALNANAAPTCGCTQCVFNMVSRKCSAHGAGLVPRCQLNHTCVLVEHETCACVPDGSGLEWHGGSDLTPDPGMNAFQLIVLALVGSSAVLFCCFGVFVMPAPDEVSYPAAPVRPRRVGAEVRGDAARGVPARNGANAARSRVVHRKFV